MDASDQYTVVSYVPKTSVDGVPDGAIIGGHLADQSPLYFAQADLMGYWDPQKNYAEYPAASSSATSTEWDFMVVHYSKYCSHTSTLFGF